MRGLQFLHYILTFTPNLFSNFMTALISFALNYFYELFIDFYVKINQLFNRVFKCLLLRPGNKLLSFFNLIVKALNSKVVATEVVEAVEREFTLYFTVWFFWRSFWLSLDILNFLWHYIVYVLILSYGFLKNTCNVVKERRHINCFTFRIFWGFCIIKLIVQYFLLFLFYFINYGSDKNNVLYFCSRCSEVNRSWFSNYRFSRCGSRYWYSICWINSWFVKEPSFSRLIVSLCYFGFCIDRSNGLISDYDGILDFEQLNNDLRLFLFQNFFTKFFYSNSNKQSLDMKVSGRWFYPIAFPTFLITEQYLNARFFPYIGPYDG